MCLLYLLYQEKKRELGLLSRSNNMPTSTEGGSYQAFDEYLWTESKEV